MWRMDKYLRRLDVSGGCSTKWQLTQCRHFVTRAWQHAHLVQCHPLPVASSRLLLFPAAAQAALVVADSNMSLQITGNGDVLEPHDGIIGALAGLGAGALLLHCTACSCGGGSGASEWYGQEDCIKHAGCTPLLCPAAIGSGSPYALAAARALIDVDGMDALTIGTLAIQLRVRLRPTRACLRRVLLALAAAVVAGAVLHTASGHPQCCSQEGHEDCGGRVHLHQPQPDGVLYHQRGRD